MNFISTYLKYILGSLVFLTIFLVGAYNGFPLMHRLESFFCGNRYHFVNKDLVCHPEPLVISKSGYVSLENKIRTLIEKEKNASRLIEASVYFRDMKNGPTFGIRQESKFVPASLLKLPLAIFFLQAAEDDADLLKRQITFNQGVKTNFSNAEAAQGLQQEFRPTEEVEANHTYTIEELLFHMIAYSDNVAQGVLLSYAYENLGGQEAQIQVFTELGIVDPSFADDTITVRGYAGLFRLLYHVSYLTPEFSEKLLSWLSQSDFKDGLEVGVPQGIEVAHKFGEREIDMRKQLHDCGVVYFPDNPYLLCVMTRGDNIHQLARVIGEISKMVYKEVESRKL